MTPCLVTIKTPPALIKPLRDLIIDFLEERKTVGNYLQPNSIVTYRGGLGMFNRFFEENNLTLNDQCLKDYLSFLSKFIQKNGEKLAPSTIQGRKACLRAFIEYGNKNKWFIISDEYKDIIKIKKRERTPLKPHLALTIDEATKLFKYAVMMESPQAMLEIIMPLVSGARRIETVAFKKCNYDLANHRMHLTVTKSGLERNIPLPEFIVKPLGEILYSFGSQDYTFPTRQAKAMCGKTLTDHIKKAATMAGINRDVTCHDLRATYATLQFYNGNLSLLELKEYLGHDDINTTSGYISLRRKLEQKNEIPLYEICQDWEAALLARMLPKI